MMHVYDYGHADFFIIKRARLAQENNHCFFFFSQSTYHVCVYIHIYIIDAN